ncbi:ObirOr5-9E6 [Ooceraea biroi]|uniref:Odorant receptor n=2 Tax=Ooceraea biroi TaxID=2015173 RepID=A0A3L8E1H2_OOCBI|nr:ObirOr5-9E6 [Ooceraea biroi]
MKISVKERYFSFNRITLLIVGLWPYQQSGLARFLRTLCLSILMSVVALMLSRLCFAQYSFEFIINQLCFSTCYTFYAILYIAFWLNREAIRYLLEQLQYIYNRLNDENEIAIYDKYGNIGKRITIACIIIAVCNQFVVVAMQCWPYIFYVILPENGTYAGHLLVVVSKYFAVQEKYSYLVLLHINIAISVGAFIFLAVGTMMLSCFKHICGMFRIASYRFEQAITTTTLQSITLKNKTMMYKELICAVDIHRKATEFIKFLVSSVDRSLFVVVIVTVLCVSFNLYGIFHIEPDKQEIEVTLSHLIILCFVFAYMFLANYAGQEIMDYNNHVFLTVYNAPWYLAPLEIQKLILILLQRSNKAFTLSIGGLFTLSLECFASLASASISYFTLMLSL